MKLKRIGIRTDPVTGGWWRVRVPPPDWVRASSEDYISPRKPGKGERAKQRRQRQPSDGTADPTPRLQLDEPGRWSLKMEVLQAAGFRCEKCKSRNRLTMDHIVPRVMGGGNHRDNMQCLCKRCNKAKGATIWAPELQNPNLDSVHQSKSGFMKANLLSS